MSYRTEILEQIDNCTSFSIEDLKKVVPNRLTADDELMNKLFLAIQRKLADNAQKARRIVTKKSLTSSHKNGSNSQIMELKAAKMNLKQQLKNIEVESSRIMDLIEKRIEKLVDG